MNEFRSLLAARAAQDPSGVAYNFLAPGRDALTLTNECLAAKVAGLASTLQASCRPGDRVLLLVSPGLDYVASFFACLVSNVVAVPAYPPGGSHHMPRLRAIIDDCNPRAVLVDTEDLGLDGLKELAQGIPLLDSADETRASLSDLPVQGDAGKSPSIAFLQYTSGSTGTPKGVMVSHENLIRNAQAAQATFSLSSTSHFVSWLPPFHDMGLIGGIITPFVVGCPASLMAPTTFVRDPLFWLETISSQRATMSPAPNFAYQMCVERADDPRVDNLDLSCWTHALNGSEPISAATFQSFADAFSRCGFQQESLIPCYGMAETTLLVSGARRGQADGIVTLADRGELANGHLVEATSPADALALVRCGPPEPDATVIIVNRDTTHECEPDEIGEIWVASPSVAHGYYENTDATAAAFGRTTADGRGPFLATGDLGLFHNGELIITGRCKDLIISGGRNVYPQDLEEAAAAADDRVTGARAAAFENSHVPGGVVVAIEVARPLQDPTHADQLRDAIYRHVAMTTDIPAEIVLVRKGKLPTTSSGKIQRSAAAAMYQDDEMVAIRARVRAVDSAPPSTAAASGVTDESRGDPGSDACPVHRRTVSNPPAGLTADDVLTRLVETLSEVTGHTVTPGMADAPLATLALTSIAVVGITSRLGDRLGLTIPTALIWESSSLRDLARRIASESPSPDNATASPSPASAGIPAGIDVLGLALRLPGQCDTPDKLADLCLRADQPLREAGTRWPAQEWTTPPHLPPTPGKSYIDRAGYIDGVDLFDADLFAITPDEAAQIDPQHRLLLESAWAALEDANIPPDSLQGSRTGVYVALSGSDYARIAQTCTPVESLNGYSVSGTPSTFAANRISYSLGLNGPSMVLDTACSSSLVAIHTAMQALRSGDCDLAIVGAVNLMLSPEVNVALCQAQMLSPTGACHTFDSRADGYVRGEGVVVMVLAGPNFPRTSTRSRGKLLGSAVAQDGRSNGLTAPNGIAQQHVIEQALAAADVHPDEVGFIEAHGTGTPLGDPVELRALQRVFDTPSRTAPLHLGAIKANLGHLEAAAGMVGLARALLIADSGLIPPVAGLSELTEAVDWRETALKPPTHAVGWGMERRVVGVSSFGIGGTIAHVVAEAAPQPTSAFGHPAHIAHASQPHVPSQSHVVKLSAATERALVRNAAAVAHTLRSSTATDSLPEIAGTLNLGRADLPYRATVVAQDTHSLADELERVAQRDQRKATRVLPGFTPRVAFLAPGHGSAVAGTLQHIIQHPAVAQMLDELGGRETPAARALLTPGQDSEERLRDTAVAQPALYTLALCLAAWWREVGIEPALVTGHSVGSYAAAAISGVFSPRDGLALVTERGRLMSERVGPGAMASLRCSEDQALSIPGVGRGGVEIAVINSPMDTVVSGGQEAVNDVLLQAQSRGIAGRVLPLNRAFHSAHMDEVLTDLARAVSAAAPREAAVPLLSDQSALLLTGQCDLSEPSYWTHHTREKVDFAAVTRALHVHSDLIIELGPYTLTGLVQRHCPQDGATSVASLTRRAEIADILTAAGIAWETGAPLNWARLTSTANPTLRLPAYAFDRRRHWLPENSAVSSAPSPTTAASLTRSQPAVPVMQHPAAVAVDDHSSLAQSRTQRHTADAIARWLREAIAQRLEVDSAHVPTGTGLFDLGLTSVMAVELRADLEREFAVDVAPTALFEHPTITALAQYLTNLTESAYAQAGSRSIGGTTLNPGANRAVVPTDTPPTSADPGVAGVQEASVAVYDTSHGPTARKHDLHSGESAGNVAIIGMACRLPGEAVDLQHFWHMLESGEDGLSDLPAGRWPDEEGARRDHDGLVTRAGFLRGDVHAFDAEAFAMSPREAASADPQQRLLLELVWEALQDAGVPRDALRGSRTGVYIGANTVDHLLISRDAASSTADPYLATGSTLSVASGRIAHQLGVHGPALTIDTACSSGLVAADTAVKALRAGTIDMAIIGGVNLMLSAATVRSLMDMGALSPRGRSYAFDESADGYGRGEGGAVLILKRTKDAARDGDLPYADILGTALNHDGESSGLTVPNGTAQADVIRAALHDAGLHAHDVDFVEAHGTGTPLGDPVELQALAKALETATRAQGPLHVTSVKASIGHLEAAAGAAGLVKVALSLSHRRIPAQTGLTQTTRLVDLASLQIHIPRSTQPWPTTNLPVAGISSFGFSGTNAHLILGPPSTTAGEPATRHHLDVGRGRSATFVLSARTSAQLQKKAGQLVDILAGDHADLAGLAWTLADRSNHEQERLAVFAENGQPQLIDALRHVALGGHARPGIYRARAGERLDRRVIALFPGTGTQWRGMGSAVLTAPEGEELMRRADEFIARASGDGARLLDGTWADSGRQELIQPAITAAQMAVFAAWRAKGLPVDTVVGFSAGEVAALACTRGLDLTDALEIARERGERLDRARGSGKTVTLGMAVDELRRIIAAEAPEVQVAAIVAPAITTIAGPGRAVDYVCQTVARHGVWSVTVSEHIAFHHSMLNRSTRTDVGSIGSSHITQSSMELRCVMAGPVPRSYDWHGSASLTPLEESADFLSALDVAADAPSIIVEMGPSPAFEQTVQSLGERALAYIPTVLPGRPLGEQLAVVAGQLYVHGATPPSRALAAPARSVRLPLPVWERRHHERPPSVQASTATHAGGDSGYTLTWVRRPNETAHPQPDHWFVLALDPDQRGSAQAVAAHLDDQCSQASSALATDLDGLHRLLTERIDGSSRVVLIVSQEQDDQQTCHALAGIVDAVRQIASHGSQTTVSILSLPRASGTAALNPVFGEALVGLCRAVSLEWPHVWSSVLHVEDAPTAPTLYDAVTTLTSLGREDVVKIQRGRALVPRLTGLGIQARPARLDPDSAYVVTGGRGTLGQRVATWLADRGARHIVLTGRSPVGDQPGDLSPDLHATVERFESRGIHVYVPAVDMSEPADVDRLLSATGPWPRVRGVLHLAGVLDPRSLADLSAQDFFASWQPKVMGAQAIEDSSVRDDLDFVVLFSSAASVWGSALAADYVMANAGLDGVARRARHLGRSTVTINWSWWPRTSMGSHFEDYFVRMGLGPVEEQMGWAALDGAVTGATEQIIAAPIDWTTFLPVMAARRERPLFDAFRHEAHQATRADDNNASSGLLRLELTELPARSRKAHLVSHLTRIIGFTLGRPDDDPVAATDGLFEIGMDSMTAVELRARIEHDLELPLEATILLDHPTIDDLSSHLLNLLGTLLPPTPSAEARSDVDAASVSTAPNAGAKSHHAPHEIGDLSGLGIDELTALLAAELPDSRT
nr:type I polyketide synthase [uncultured Arsenicicoccus sp.]